MPKIGFGWCEDVLDNPTHPWNPNASIGVVGVIGSSDTQEKGGNIKSPTGKVHKVQKDFHQTRCGKKCYKGVIHKYPLHNWEETEDEVDCEACLFCVESDEREKMVIENESR